VETGAQFAVTQPVFDLSLLERFLRRIEHCRIPVLAGIWPLTSVRNAEFMRNELRVSVPDLILERMAAASSSSEQSRAEGVLIAREMLLEARSMVQGVQVSAPLGKFAAAVDVIEALGQRSET
jgi:5,10-methylenetetrahydrofolate reductase